MREAVEVAHVAVQGQQVILTVSIGVASVPDDQVTRFTPGTGRSPLGETMAGRWKPHRRRGKGTGGGRKSGRAAGLELLAADRPERSCPICSASGQVLPLLRVLDKGIGVESALAKSNTD